MRIRPCGLPSRRNFDESGNGTLSDTAVLSVPPPPLGLCARAGERLLASHLADLTYGFTLLHHAAPIDARAALSKRVLVVGGGSLIPGLDARLLDELRALGVDAGVLTAPCAACDAAWVGASLLAASTTLTGAARGDSLPDLYEMRHGLPAVVAPQCGV